MLLDRKSLLKKEEVVIEKVDLGKEEFVYVRQMSGRERDTFEKSLLEEKKDKDGNIIGFSQSTQDYRAKLAVVTICDEKGNTILQPDDYESLSINMGAKRLEKIINAAQRINAISEQDKENLTKNSEGDQIANSSSDSASN